MYISDIQVIKLPLDQCKKEKVDLVIADIKMPQMTGLELLEHIRKEKISDAYFVILSGYAEFHLRHFNIGNNQIYLFLLQKSQCFHPICCCSRNPKAFLLPIY